MASQKPSAASHRKRQSLHPRAWKAKKVTADDGREVEAHADGKAYVRTPRGSLRRVRLVRGHAPVEA